MENQDLTYKYVQQDTEKKQKERKQIMIVNLNTVKTHKNYQMLFISRFMGQPIRICMEHAGITDYKIFGTDTETFIPSGKLTPPMIPLIPGRTRMRPAALILISHLDSKELEDLMEDIYYDDNVQDYRRKINEVTAKGAEYRKDG